MSILSDVKVEAIATVSIMALRRMFLGQTSEEISSNFETCSGQASAVIATSEWALFAPPSQRRLTIMYRQTMQGSFSYGVIHSLPVFHFSISDLVRIRWSSYPFLRVSAADDLSSVFRGGGRGVAFLAAAAVADVLFAESCAIIANDGLSIHLDD